jgi:hypothetical protein
VYNISIFCALPADLFIRQIAPAQAIGPLPPKPAANMPSPMMTATLQATGLSTASNISAQFILAYQAKVSYKVRNFFLPFADFSQRPFTLDIIQLLRFIALSFMTSPPNYIWQQFLERTFPAYPAPPPSTSAPGGADIELKMAAHGSTPSHLESGTAIPGVPAKFSLQNTFTKWFVDCITLGAVGNTVAFLVLMGIMKGQDWTQIKSNISTVRLSPTRHSRILLIRPGNGTDHRGWLQDVAHCFHH